MIPNSLFVWGETKDTERDQIRKEIRQGKIRVLIASKVFALGIDLPNLEVGINASGGKAEILTGQRLGRMMRTWHDIVKKWIDIFDDYHPKLAAHSKERLLVYKRKQTRINYIGFSPRKKEMLDALDQDAVIDERDSDYQRLFSCIQCLREHFLPGSENACKRTASVLQPDGNLA